MSDTNNYQLTNYDPWVTSLLWNAVSTDDHGLHVHSPLHRKTKRQDCKRAHEMLYGESRRRSEDGGELFLYLSISLPHHRMLNQGMQHIPCTCHSYSTVPFVQQWALVVWGHLPFRAISTSDSWLQRRGSPPTANTRVKTAQRPRLMNTWASHNSYHHWLPSPGKYVAYNQHNSHDFHAMHNTAHTLYHMRTHCTHTPHTETHRHTQKDAIFDTEWYLILTHIIQYRALVCVFTWRNWNEMSQRSYGCLSRRRIGVTLYWALCRRRFLRSGVVGRKRCAQSLKSE